MLIVQPSSLVQATQYAITDLEACLRDLIIMVKYMPSLQQQAVREKYKTTKYVLHLSLFFGHY